MIAPMDAPDRLTAQDCLILAERYERAAQESSSSAVRLQLEAIAGSYAALAKSTARLAQSEQTVRWLKAR
jgi:hypothetical protein